MHHSFCPLCRSVSIQSLYEAVRVWNCLKCGLSFRNPQPNNDELADLYLQSYDAANISAGTTRMAGTTLSLARRYVRCLSKTQELRGKAVLDFGAGLGTMSIALMEYGAEVVAVEPFARHECEKVGIKTYRSLGDLPEGSRFDAIVAVDVVEHLHLPWVTLKELRALLSPTGWLYVATLNANGLNARISGARWREIVKPTHLIFFNQRTLEHTLKEAGFQHFFRLKWFIRYSNNPAIILLHWLLQHTGLDGELKYLAQKD